MSGCAASGATNHARLILLQRGRHWRLLRGETCSAVALAMRGKIEQPPIQPALRDPERHDFWTGFVFALIGLIVLACGAWHTTGLETTDGNSAAEPQLVKAFSSGGIRFLDLTAPPPPPNPDDPAAVARAQELLQRQSARASGPRWQIKVDTGATGGCPT
jgi:hypothetical protein